MEKGIEDTDMAACLRWLNVSMKNSLDEMGRERFFLFCESLLLTFDISVFIRHFLFLCTRSGRF
jgi:hypothetical protein